MKEYTNWLFKIIVDFKIGISGDMSMSVHITPSGQVGTNSPISRPRPDFMQVMLIAKLIHLFHSPCVNTFWAEYLGIKG
jgi:hypothetical protein